MIRSVTPACFSTKQTAKGSADDTSLQGGWGPLDVQDGMAASAEATGVCVCVSVSLPGQVAFPSRWSSL